MCGIGGYFARDGAVRPADPERLLLSIQRALLHRGPDGQGTWLDAQCAAGLAHVRLAILDTSTAGAQPMRSDDGRFVISFNGEIYNFRELREGLQGKGCTFRSDSDTEVLLALLGRDGPAGLARLRGMFALALWDVHAGRGLLARDGFGIKPLYYAQASGGLFFASELHALVAGNAVPMTLDPAAVAGYFATGSVPEPATLLQDVHMLPPGHYLAWSGSRAEVKPFWEITFPPPSNRDAAGAIALARDALEESVAAHLTSDVPVGLFLSGGIDSTALLALAHARGSSSALTAFSVAVDDAHFNEADVAAQTAREFGVEHHVLHLDAVAARDSFGAFLDDMDMPSIDGFNTWTVARFARRHGIKVVLSGLGGDEMFGGYPSFRQVPRLRALARGLGRVPGMGVVAGRLVASAHVGPRWRRALELVQAPTGLADAYRAYRGIFPLVDAVRLASHFTGVSVRSVQDALVAGAAPLPASAMNAVSYLELSRYMRNQLLRDSDVMSMAHGVELRLPFVDQRLFDKLATIPASTRLQAGKELLLDAVPEIPARVQGARKRGFSFPIRAWLGQELGCEFSAATGGLPVAAGEWYQQWSVLTLTRWLGKRR
jgi:asparagine synthase (glutamine-hydrolysing)